MDAKAIPISKDGLRYLRHFQRSNYRDLESIHVPEKIQKEMRRALSFYIATVMEGQLKTPTFIRQIEYKPDKRKI
jgi:DNA repair protein RecO (recombination protein O)